MWRAREGCDSRLGLQHVKLWTVTELLSAETGVCGEHGKGVIVDSVYKTLNSGQSLTELLRAETGVCEEHGKGVIVDSVYNTLNCGQSLSY